MSARAVYHCNVCGRDYTPIEAARRQYRCCRQPLERMEIHPQGRRAGFLERLERAIGGLIGEPPAQQEQTPAPGPTSTAQPQETGAAYPPPSRLEEMAEPPPAPPPASEGAPPARLELVEIIPPLNNTVDALQMEHLLASLGTRPAPLSFLQRLLGATETLEAAIGPFSLEIAGDEMGKHFYIRAHPAVLTHIQRQFRRVYKQVEFRPVPPERDPARRLRGAVYKGVMTLTEPCYLPLRTHRDGDFQDADPLDALLGAFSDCTEGEIALSQLILKRAPHNWGKKWLGSTRRIETGFAGPTMTTEANVKILTFTIMAIGFMVGIVWAAMSWVMGNHLPALILLLLFPIVAPILWFIRRSMPVFQRIDPDMVKSKVQLPAHDAVLRICAAAPQQSPAQRRLQQLASAYALFNMASGNSLALEIADFDPTTFPPIYSTVAEVLSAHPINLFDLAMAVYQSISARRMRLNVAEVASMWHLPVGEVDQVELALEKPLIPRADQVAEGTPIGYAGDQRQILVRLSPEAMRSHILVIGKTQKGKSILMQHLAAAAMGNPDCCLVVVDAHGDLVRSLLSLVPEERIPDTLYLDFSDEERAVGLNLLDLNQGIPIDKIVSNLVHIGKRLWTERETTYWGPRMEDAWRYGIKTLLEVNEELNRQGRAQFTILDVNNLFNYDGFRQYLLDHFPHSSQVLSWWGGYFENLTRQYKVEIPNPVKTKIDRFIEATVIRRILGQSDSTINLREILAQRRILLVNTASGVIGEDAGGLLGGVIINNLNLAIREQQGLPPERRARVMVCIDEFQAIPGVDYGSLLAELAKMGANFILSTQSLAQLDVLDPLLKPVVLANVDTIFVFQTSAADARELAWELDKRVDEVDIINLPDYTCYLKTKKGHERLPTIQVRTLPPLTPNPQVTRRVLERLGQYTRPAATVDAQRAQFERQWYERWASAAGGSRREYTQSTLPGMAGAGTAETTQHGTGENRGRVGALPD